MIHTMINVCNSLSLHEGDRVVHSYGRLIPHEFPITDLQQISVPNGIGRITCTVSSGTARFYRPGGQVNTGGVSETRNGATSTLVVNPSNVKSFQNRDLYCTNFNNFFYLFISSTSKSLSSVSKYTYSTISSAHNQYLANIGFGKYILKMLSLSSLSTYLSSK